MSRTVTTTADHQKDYLTVAEVAAELVCSEANGEAPYL